MFDYVRADKDKSIFVFDFSDKKDDWNKFLEGKYFDKYQNISERFIYKVTVMCDVVFAFVMWGAKVDQLIYKDGCNNHHPHIFAVST